MFKYILMQIQMHIDTGITTLPPKQLTIKVENDSIVKKLDWEGSSLYDYVRKGVYNLYNYNNGIIPKQETNNNI